MASAAPSSQCRRWKSSPTHGWITPHWSISRALRELTDAVGGVTVYNRTAFTSNGVHFPKGNITVSGERAIYFVGERRALPRGDFDRALNERNVVRAILAKTLSTQDHH